LAAVVAVDVGGTKARFALATVSGGTAALTATNILPTDEFDSFEDAWRAFDAAVPQDLPGAAAIAVAGPVRGGRAAMTNHHWRLEAGALEASLGLQQVVLLNDLEAAAWAAAAARPGQLETIKPGHGGEGTVSVIGLGTGLGGATLVEGGDQPIVRATECGHIGFSPQDEFERLLSARLEREYGRVSAERAVSGAALPFYHELVGGAPFADEVALWNAALGGDGDHARQALDRFCAAFGSVAGDIALAQGAARVVLTGGLAARIAGRLRNSDFAERFAAKDRMRPLLEGIAVDHLAIENAGLVGAALALGR
jgi:glucokinase